IRSQKIKKELLPLEYNCESSSDEDVYNAESFKEFLSSWVLRHKIPTVAVSEILKHLRLYPGFENLPSDYRTVMKTPSQVRWRKIMFFGKASYSSLILTEFLYLKVPHNSFGLFLATSKLLLTLFLSSQEHTFCRPRDMRVTSVALNVRYLVSTKNIELFFAALDTPQEPMQASETEQTKTITQEFPH
ncbi:unnamed protein product, partial [Allacma fusca]